MKTWRSFFIPILVSLASFGIPAQSSGQQTDIESFFDSSKLMMLSLSYVDVSERYKNFAEIRDDNLDGNVKIAADSTTLAREMLDNKIQNQQPECKCILCPPRGVLMQHFKNPAGIYHSFGGALIGGSGR